MNTNVKCLIDADALCAVVLSDEGVYARMRRIAITYGTAAADALYPAGVRPRYELAECYFQIKCTMAVYRGKHPELDIDNSTANHALKWIYAWFKVFFLEAKDSRSQALERMTQ